MLLYPGISLASLMPPISYYNAGGNLQNFSFWFLHLLFLYEEYVHI